MKGFDLSDIEETLVNEKSENKLSDLPEDFYEKSASYVSEISREIEKSDELRKELLKAELDRVLDMVQEIHFLRTLKITEYSGGVDRERLLPRERKAFENIRKQLEKISEDLIEPVVRGESGLEPPRETANVLLLISSDIPTPIVGADMRSYGPFESGEIANVSGKTGQLMLDQGLAERLDVMES